MPGQQVFYSCDASLMFARRIVIVELSQRDISTAYDEDHAYFIVSEVLGTLKKKRFQTFLQWSPLGSIMAAAGAHSS